MGRHRTLEEMDGDHWKDEGVSPYSSGLWGVAQAARAALARKRRAPVVVPPTTKVSGPGTEWLCWCTQPYGHDWPGKAEGAPHPR